ncbi:class IV adenylate cyclase [Halobellus marinus]|uniref:class IV adenylate cyclase n=1 Tax=Halobellus TaxID=1073986 RepID=UPI0028ABDA01|nr:class IV adenylate cyclase [Halobellus sp. DFY28]
MYEVEIKVPASHDAVRPALLDADAERVERVRQVDTYYDAPHRDFAETDEALRLRREMRESDSGSNDGPNSDAETAILTYKGPLVDADSKTREEHETVVADGDGAAAVFDGLGFEPAAVVEKEREFFALDGYTVTLDSVTDLGEFVEIEGHAEDSADVAAVRDGAAGVLRRLGLEPADQIRTSYLGLLLDGENSESPGGE